MKDKNKRNLYLKVRVSQEEMDAIKRKFQNSGMDTLSGFIRAMIFEGYIVQMDGNELRQIHKLASNIASSINQIAVRVNSTGRIYDNDIAEIKDGVNKLWQPLNFLQTKILQLKHGSISVQMKMMSGIIPTALKANMCALNWTGFGNCCAFHKNYYNFTEELDSGIVMSYNIAIIIFGGAVMFKIPELATPRTYKVTTVCNGKREVWENREDAKDFFIRQMMITEGEEHDRYECIYIQLLHGLSECSDEDE